VTILDQALADPDTKAIIFSEWVGMLELIREHLEREKIGYAWHTGSVPQKKRRAEINAFKQDPACRIFLCSESGGVGLNLQNASLVINVDLPWNPAKLEQRIARAWRKGQTRPVHVINLIAESTIEHGMLETLAHKQGLADGVLDGIGELSEIKLKKGGQSFLSRLEQTLEIGKVSGPGRGGGGNDSPPDPAIAFATKLHRALGDQLIHCEEHFPAGDAPSKLYIVTLGLGPVTMEAVHDQLKKCYPQFSSDPAWLEENVILMNTASHEAILKLQRAGLIQTNTRAKRDLLRPGENNPPKSDPRLIKLAAERAEEIRAAAVLISAKLHHLAPAHQHNALLKTAQIGAIRNALNPPENLTELREESHRKHLPEALQPFLKTLTQETEIIELQRVLKESQV
jgi:hypothetical protein